MATVSDIIIPVSASIASAIVAAVVSFIVGRGLKEHEWRLGLAKDRLVDRRQLYGKFLAESDRMLSSGIASDMPLSMEAFAPIVSLNAEISLVANEDVRNGARAVCSCAMSLLMSKEQQKQEDTDFFVAKSTFLEAARAELAGFESEFAKKGVGRLFR